MFQHYLLLGFRYELEVLRLDRNIRSTTSVVAATERNLTSLLPNVEYRVRVRPATRAYTGVWSEPAEGRTANAGMSYSIQRISTLFL